MVVALRTAQESRSMSMATKLYALDRDVWHIISRRSRGGKIVGLCPPRAGCVPSA